MKTQIVNARVLLLAMFGLLLLSSAAPRVTDAAPPAQIHDDVCRVLPNDPGLGKLSTGSISGNCVAEYDFSYPGGHQVFQFMIAGDDDVASAKTDLGYHKSWHPTVGGGKLTYTVLYTPNGGKSWYPLEVDTTDPQLAIQTSEIANGDQVQFRILASGGLNTTQADSPPIQVRNGIALAATPQSLGSTIASPTDSSSLIILGIGGATLCGVLGVLFIAGLVVITRPRARPERQILPQPERLPTRTPRPTNLPERNTPRKPTDLPK